MVTSRFQPSDYLQYRQEYPVALFNPLRSSLASLNRTPQVLDLGAGTGYSAASFLKFFPAAEVTLLEPDPFMLEAAVKYLDGVRGIQGSAEKIPLPDESLDTVIVGSAWHWMNSEKAISELLRVLRPGGMIFIFEYQFPKAEAKGGQVNEWIRRQFNLVWKAPAQTPRGSLFEITEPLRSHACLHQKSFVQLTEGLSLSPQFLGGVIFSQSRYQHFELSLPESERDPVRFSIIENLERLYVHEKVIYFQYAYQGYLFRKRSS